MAEFYYFENQIKNRLVVLESLDKNTYNDVNEFLRILKLNNYSTGRMAKYVNTIKKLREIVQKDFRELDKKDIENFIIGLNTNTILSDKGKPYEESTKTDYKKMFKFYIRWIKLGTIKGKYPDEVEWIPVDKKKHREKPADQFLTREEVERIASATDDVMNKAFVLSMGETGTRIGEWLNVKLKDIRYTQNGCVINISGKTGARPVIVFDYLKEFNAWLESHPQKTNTESYLWINPRTQRRVLPGNTAKMILRLALKVGITKKVNPHQFRHFRASEMSEIFTDQQMNGYFGWSRNSNMASTYVHRNGQNIIDSVLKSKGIKSDSHSSSISTIRSCNKCNEQNSNVSIFCKKCNYPMDSRIILESEDLDRKKNELFLEVLKHFAQKDKTFGKIFTKIAKEKGLGEILTNIQKVEP